ncbi:MAG: tRNA 2-thiouridine(34) synthase MnmA [Clostridiales bacterium]|nr:tRNA 2-thiouridine(34) synthase MnmA [Clostridiales bacterium]
MRQNTKEKVLLGISGGVDSSVAAILLQDQGYEVIGVTMKLWRDEDFSNGMASDTIEQAKAVCDKLGIDHVVCDLGEDFKRFVVDDFISCYANCITPNPCIECNRHLKFGKMIELADSLGAKYVATGHYARCCYDEARKRYVIKRSFAGKKDQSYVLYVVDGNILDRILFPLGEFQSKDDIRQVALDRGLITAKKRDSQEICFIPNNDTRGFIDKYIPAKQGNVVHKNGKVLGKHNGICHYTIGQRKGMGISYPEPIFVTRLDKESNTVYVGCNEDLFSSELTAKRVNWLALDALDEPIRLTARVRYSAPDVPCTVYPMGDRIKVILDEPQRAITSGQSVVFYDGDVLMGGGIIE